METAIGAAKWLLGKVLAKLSDELVATFVASSELGHNFQTIKRRLMLTQGLLYAAQDRDLSDNPGLYGLLEELSKKADEAEDVLDEIHYFMIQHQLDGTSEAAPQMGDVIRGHVRHVRHAFRHNIGNWLPYFSSPPTQYDDLALDAVNGSIYQSHKRQKTNSSNPCDAANSGSVNGGGPIDRLSFDRVNMSNRIKFVIEEMNSICEPVSDLLKIANQSSTATSTPVTLKRPPTGSTVVQDKLFGRSAIFEKTVTTLTGGTYHTKTLTVLPFVGPGGIGKTTFTQHLYNDERIVGHFILKVWVCVSTDFDVLKLTQQILSCILASEKDEHKCTYEISNLDLLQKSIVQRLRSKRFLVVLDDIWKCSSETDWNNLLAPFKQGGTKGSIVLVTTRVPAIAHLVKTTNLVELNGLEPDDFFEFFESCIFGHSKPGHYEDGLIEVAKEIAKKLKGSPLAANTVGRLLKKNLSWEYWMGVLEKNEWQHTKHDDDIMPSLRISYDCLPFLLKKCFSYCALFPEDYKFYNVEITSLWTAVGILDSCCQNDNKNLEELVENGFLMKGVDSSNVQYYVMHDLLHELSRNVSSQECFNISSVSVSADNIPRSIRHLSITIEDVYNITFEEELGKLKGVIDIKNLRTLMLFGFHNARIANVLKDTFEELKGLRVLFIAINTPRSLPNSFSKLIHLQHLKISSLYSSPEMTLPSTLSRFYHLKFLDLEDWNGSTKLPRDISRLVNLCHFHSSKEIHSNIPEVGKMKSLQELKEFHVKKEGVGFELRELGELAELGGELIICNIENVSSKGEATAARLKNKKNLKGLKLVGSTVHYTIDDDILDGLQPHPNLRVLGIINPGVSPCPEWLCGNITMKKLQGLHLEGLSWDILPPFEQLSHLTSLTLKNIAGMCVFGPGSNGVTERSFMHLKTLEFMDMPGLVEWVGEPNSHMFSMLESIKLVNCPLLNLFPFLEHSDRFTNLCSLYVDRCPELSQFPPMPHTSTLTWILIRNAGSMLRYIAKELNVEGYNSALAFRNMDKVEVVNIVGVSRISLSDLQKLNSLRSIYFKNCDDMFSAELDDNIVLHSVQNLGIHELFITGELFSKVLKCFPALSHLTITKCKRLELLPVEDGGLSDLRLLQAFTGNCCQKLFSRWPMGEVGGEAHAIKPFPSSLRELDISYEPSMQSMGLLSNLTSLTSLSLRGCDRLTMDGFNPLITVNLKKFTVDTWYQLQGRFSIVGDLLSEIARSKLMHAGSFELEELIVDSISAVLTAPICSHLAATLHKLVFVQVQWETTFTDEQKQALQLLTSLRNLEFRFCPNLQCLPQWLRGLSSLKSLVIFRCKKILCLPPKENLPSSLEELVVEACSPELIEQAKNLKGTSPWFSVYVYVPREL